jgi:hypothetical protein
MPVELRLSDRLTLSVVDVAGAFDFEHRRFSPSMFSSAFLRSGVQFEQALMMAAASSTLARRSKPVP